MARDEMTPEMTGEHTIHWRWFDVGWFDPENLRRVAREGWDRTGWGEG